MGHQPNKYHISDDGKVYRINPDGSFTAVGNIEDIEKKAVVKTPPITTSPVKSPKAGWWKRNYNWLWVMTLFIFIGWFISCLSCSEFEYQNWYVDHYVYDYASYPNEVLALSFIILSSLTISWSLTSRTRKVIFKWLQIVIIILAICLSYIMSCYLDPMYATLLLGLAFIPFAAWIATLCLSIFRCRKYIQY